MAERRYLPRFPVEHKLYIRILHPDKATGRDEHLWDLMGAYNSAARLRTEFEAAKAKLDNDLATRELGEAGYQRRCAELVRDFHKQVDAYRPAVEKARDRQRELITTMTNPSPLDKPSPTQEIAAELKSHRAIERFERLAPDQRREAIRRALDARNADFLRPLMNEPGLIDEPTGRRIELMLMASAAPGDFAELQELGGVRNLGDRRDGFCARRGQGIHERGGRTADRA